MAHDFVRGRTIIFGGGNGNTFGDETWEYDGTNWTQMKPKTSPPVRRGHVMVYHFAHLKTVMFGGIGPAGFLNDTWVWDGKDWTQMKPTNSPPGRWSHGMAYDSGRQRTVLFSGLVGSGPGNDTWEWDGKNWTEIKTKNAPSGRIASLAYDSTRKRIVLFGGSPNGSSFVADTWEYAGKDWTKMTPTKQPSARCCAGIAYDPTRKRTVMFGGALGLFQETWEYDGKTWTQMRPATQPPGRYDFDMMVYDQKRKRMVIFGGLGNGSTLFNDTWEYVASQSLTGTPPTISIATGGTHAFSLNAGTANASRLYWVFGSITGTSPGIILASAAGSVTIPLNPDVYTDLTNALANTPLLTKTRGTLDNQGKATASLNVPRNIPTAAIGLKLYHAYLVYDAKNNFYMASNPVELMLVK